MHEHAEMWRSLAIGRHSDGVRLEAHVYPDSADGTVLLVQHVDRRQTTTGGRGSLSEPLAEDFRALFPGEFEMPAPDDCLSTSEIDTPTAPGDTMYFVTVFPGGTPGRLVDCAVRRGSASSATVQFLADLDVLLNNLVVELVDDATE